MTFGISNKNYLIFLKRLFTRKAFFILFVVSISAISFIPLNSEVYLNMESYTLEEGKYIKVKSEVLFNTIENKMITYFKYPREYYFISNAFGEAKIYIPSSNSVLIKYGNNYSTSSSYLMSFLNHQQADFGLKGQGFQLKKSYFEDEYFITLWIPPSPLMALFTEVKLVTLNNFPIFCGYYDSNKKEVQKIYFSDYQSVLNSKIPTRITQISYLGLETDSSINKIVLSNIKTGLDLANHLRDFKIPEDAVLVE